MKTFDIRRIFFKGSFCFAFVMISLVAISLLMGCGGMKKERMAERDPFLEKWRAESKASSGHSPGPSASDKSLHASDSLPEIRKNEDLPVVAFQKPVEETRTGIDLKDEKADTPLPKEPVSLRMRDVNLPTLLRALARIANQNIMISENVKGTASIDIHKAPWDEVFTGLLATHGLDYQWVGDIIRIVSIDDLKARQALLEETQKSEKALREHGLKMKALQKQEARNEAMETMVIPVRYANLEKLKENIEQVLEAGMEEEKQKVSENKDASGSEVVPIGKVLMDEHSYSLIIHARKSYMPLLKTLVTRLDRPTPQVHIEAHIVEASRTTARDLGIRWGGLLLNASGNQFNWIGSEPSGEGQQLYDGTTPAFSQPSSGDIVNTINDNLTEAPSIAFQWQKKGLSLLSIQLKALEEEGKLNILSSPSITTVDNSEASIESGKEVPFQTVEDGETKVEYKPAVLKLIVTPHVIDDRTLRLDIETNNDELDFTNAVGGQPAITTKKAKTTVVVFNGQTTVIGGLAKNKTDNSEEGVPGLRDVPMLGALFKGTSKSDELEELMIFITPYILEEASARPVSSSGGNP